MPNTVPVPTFAAPTPEVVEPREDPDFLDSSEAHAHADEARQIEQDLIAVGIHPERVAPTRDCRGHVRLSFQQVRQLLLLSQ